MSGHALPPADAGPHAFVADLDTPELDVDDRHHLGTVLRLRDGDRLTVSDGEGRWRPCRFGDPLVVDGPVVVAPPRPHAVAVAFALVKGGRPELVVQKLTELGVDRIVAFEAERSVVRWQGERSDRHAARLAKVAREAAMQSRQCRLPAVEVGAALDGLAAADGAVLADRGGRALGAGDRLVLVGPEGGWTAAERAGRPTVGLSPHVLRAETAAIAAATLLTALRDRSSGHAP